MTRNISIYTPKMTSYNEMGFFMCMKVWDHNFWKWQVIFQCIQSIILIQAHLSEKSSTLQPQVGILDSFGTSNNAVLGPFFKIFFSANFNLIAIVQFWFL